MAASNMKAVKLRIKSVQNTMQITKAMQLVAASKLRKAKEKADHSKPYLNILKSTLTDIARENNDFQSPYTKSGADENRWLYIVIAGDRGLAGGYNSNLFKFMEAERAGKDIDVLPVGKKAVEYFRRRGVNILTEEYAEVARISVSDSFGIAKLICNEFSANHYGHVMLCYTDFVSMLSQIPRAISFLPLSDLLEHTLEWEEMNDDGKNSAAKKAAEDVAASLEAKDLGVILYEPDSESVFNTIVPEYLAGLVYTSVNISVASELAARRTAMEAATDNAGEMIEKLSLYYNRARQASITQEITEIVAGAEGQ
ncbi:MAG: ATP synthase F1 subunit gamma [Lachnospiraceae bacterium]|nr:ATP synthase F1 subunit gamma [Lachnospiraceae bacterium]